VNVEVEAAPTGPEQLWQVRPLGDRLVAGTSTGRIFCLDSNTGKLIWQTRVSSRPIERLVASEDFTAVRVGDENNAVRLIVVDNYNGQIQMVRNFAGETGIAPVNLALSADGMLVWTLPDRICGKDLYEPGNTLKYEFPAAVPDPNNGRGINPLYVGCNKPGQLLIRGQQIIALEQGGRFVSVHSLEDGTLAKHNDRGQLAPTMLSSKPPAGSNQQPGNGDVSIFLRTAGPYLYIVGPRSLVAYNLDRPAEDQWEAKLDTYSNPNFRNAIATRDFLAVIGEPAAKRPAENGATPSQLYRVHLFSRAKTKTDPPIEVGKYEYWYDLTDPSGVSNWQAVDGGLYYLTGDHKLHFLRGTRG
jgi:hypothetical protein